MNNLNSKKFVLAIISFCMLGGIFSIMLVHGWLTAKLCMKFSHLIWWIYATYCGYNIGAKVIDKIKSGGNKNV